MFKKDKIFNVYIKKGSLNPIEDAVFIPEGFSIMAFIFNFFWALYYKVWILALLYIAYTVFLTVLDVYGFVGEDGLTVLRLGFFAWVGFEANDWRRESLERKNYILCDVVYAENEDSAHYKFIKKRFDNNDQAEGNSTDLATT